MIIRVTRFNSYFWLALLTAVCLAGCQSPDKKKSKLQASFRVHLEVTDPRMAHSIAPIYRAQPVNLNVEKTAFLTEVNIADAKVVESQGVLAVVIQLERKGTWTLENYTSANPGRHYAIFSQWGEKQTNTRWLAAPIISYRITDGMLSFTPDATKEECEEIVAGLRNVARAEGNLVKDTKKK
jgi:preprotein translocase subunit SecD